eukprot:1013686-Prymnesium_polylepis.1
MPGCAHGHAAWRTTRGVHTGVTHDRRCAWCGRQEHGERVDSRIVFTSSNGLTSVSQDEWE